MRNYKLLIHFFLIGILLTACSSDDDNASTVEFVVAFEQPSIQLSNDLQSREVQLMFSRPAPQNGTLNIQINSDSSVYDEDFSTFPEAVENQLELSFEAGETNTNFTFEQLTQVLEGEEKSIEFEITEVSIPNTVFSGNTFLTVNLSESAALGGSFEAEVGGPNQPNQVFINLSGQQQTVVSRDAWDLAFYSGNKNRVILNYSTQMAVGKTEFTNLAEVNQATVETLIPQIAIGNFNPENMVFVDEPSGDLNQTAMDEVSSNPEENHVYILNLGNEIGTDTPQPGSVAVSGVARGYLKIRVLLEGDQYLLQYADLNATEFNEVSIPKSSGFNHTFFNLNQQSIVQVEPEKHQWDLNFTVFTNEIPNAGSYMFTDFILTNRHGGTKAYQVNTDELSYSEFTYENVDPAKFSNDQRTIGSNWRQGGGPGQAPSLFEDRFFILQDTQENVYKLRFSALLSETGERGFPAFEYQLLN
ncbi:MAG: hypothetical protein LAT51_02205 [Flavobacteriaceae bacterium]|nr:hypothetical protein [Flavobacteriaceae bacterium]